MRWALVSCVIVVAACGSSPPPPGPVAASSGLVASNVLRRDYAGSEACADCHAELHAKWAASPMRNMTRDAASARVEAPFDGASLRVGNDTATMTTEHGARFMTVTRPAGVEKFRITKIVGGHYREDFVGVEVRGGFERVLPATYVFATRSWRYKGYSVMVKERPGMSTNGVWQRECIPCHNTLPLATMLYDELGGPGVPAYQGKLQDRLVPKRLEWRATPRDAAGLARALVEEIRFLGMAPPPTADLAMLVPATAHATGEQLDASKLVEIGVGCEACHNGSREHAQQPERLPTFAVQSDVLAVSPPPKHDGRRAQWINHTCAKCHTVLFSRYPWTWEGGERRKNPGGSTTNSGEGRDFKLGGCASEMACTTCHDPHTVDSPEKLAAQATIAGNRLCATCHGEIAANPTAHSHHAPTSAGNSCIACHMPKKNMGLDYSLVRYHRIGSPNDPVRVAGDRPLECALCHADKSIESLASTMEKWWGKKIERGTLTKLYGADLATNAIRATLLYGKPHEQAVALAVLGEARDRAAIPLIVPHLAHEYPLVRFYAHRALERVVGERVPIDVGRSAAEVRAAASAWQAARP